jgi:2-oxoglutaroyl-CoA hydrolase
MTDPAPLLPALPDIFDGFRLEIDPARERADVILDRAPLNVITMAEREQLRAVFEALDADARVRVIVLRAGGSIFERRRDPRLSRCLARACLAPRLEHRRAGALP